MRPRSCGVAGGIRARLRGAGGSGARNAVNRGQPPPIIGPARAAAVIGSVRRAAGSGIMDSAIPGERHGTGRTNGRRRASFSAVAAAAASGSLLSSTRQSGSVASPSRLTPGVAGAWLTRRNDTSINESAERGADDPPSPLAWNAVLQAPTNYVRRHNGNEH